MKPTEREEREREQREDKNREREKRNKRTRNQKIWSPHVRQRKQKKEAGSTDERQPGSEGQKIE